LPIDPLFALSAVPTTPNPPPPPDFDIEYMPKVKMMVKKAAGGGCG
jgi:hypothetical protein